MMGDKSLLKQILVTGVDGQVGSELNRLLGRNARVIGLNRHGCDLAQVDRLAEIIKSARPDGIVNAAAYTAVDRAETEEELARIINDEAVGVMADIAKKLNIPFVHISTDYVFNGRNYTPYLETDDTDPVSIYGKTKLAGERKIEAIGGKYLNLRTAWVYGCHGKGNFVKTMLRLGEARSEIKVVADQIGTPTWAKTIARTIDLLLPQLDEEKIDPGTYHLTNSGAASWYDFAVAIFEEAQKLGFPLQVKDVIPITTADYPTPATRPAYSVLSNAKIHRALGFYLPHWRQDLVRMLTELK